MKKNKITAVALSAVIVVILFVWWLWPSGGADIPTYTVKRGDFNIYVVESGAVRSKNSFTITAPRIFSGGNLQVVSLAPEGTIAQVDQVLVRFDPTAAMKRISDKQTELQAALADLAKLKAQQAGEESQAETEYQTANLNFQLATIQREKMQFEPEARRREAEIEFERARMSFEQSKLNLDNKRIIRKSELGNLQLRIQQIRSDIGVSEKEMEQLTIKAPISGLIVYETNWSTGRKITTGDQPWPGMPVISLPDLSVMQTEVSVNEMDIAKVKKDQRVMVIPDAFPDKNFMGTISSVSQIGREKGQGSNVKVFDIVVDLDSSHEVLKPGITTTNKIIVGTVKKVLSIPIISVFEEEGKTWVFVRNGSSFDKRRVELDQRNDNFVVVIKGLSEGDRVALRNPEKEADEAVEADVPQSANPSATGAGGKK
jgi:HlyD family secretion protein